MSIRWSTEGDAELKLPGHHVSLADVGAVWYRRPVPPTRDPALTEGQAMWARAEAMEALDGVIRTLQDARWVNHPDRNRAASFKPLQLRAAAALGFEIPRTLLTNDRAVARAFVSAQSDGAVMKSIRQGRITDGELEQLFFTSALGGDSGAFDTLGSDPSLFQERIAKRADVRVTVIGEDAFAVRIHSQDAEASRVDFRRVDPSHLPHEPFALPAAVAERCVRLVADAGCLFGAIDLLERNDGDFVFLENNPNGQWAWLEQRCSVPLRGAMADLLLAP